MVQPNLDPTYALAKDISDAQARIGRLEQADIKLEGLHDVALSSQTNGQALVWNSSTQKWINAATASSLASLTDVQITSPTNAQVLKYNSALSKWVNATGGSGGFIVSATAPSSPNSGDGWYNLSNGLIFLYVNDGDSSQWVQDVSIANDAGYESRLTALETFNTVPQAVSVGGTGAATLTSGGYLKGNGTGAVTSVVGIPATDITSGVLGYARLPTGSILQVINASTFTTASVASTTPVDTNLTATITPKYSTSKILVFVNQVGLRKDTGHTENSVRLKLVRNGTDILTFASLNLYSPSAGYLVGGASTATYLDSPATTSAVTYKTQIWNYVNTGTVGCQWYNDNSTITLMEVAG